MTKNAKNSKPKYITLTISGHLFPGEPSRTFPLCRYGKRGWAAPIVLDGKKRAFPHEEASKVTLDLTKKQFKKLRKKLKKHIRNGKYANMFQAIRELPVCFENASAAAQLVLLSVLSWTGTLLVGTLTLPLIQLSDATPQTFHYVGELLSLFHGPQQWKGRNYVLKRPMLLKVKRSLMYTTPSEDVGEYIGGHYIDLGKRRAFWLPYFNQTVVFDPSLPGSVAQSILSASPFALFVTDTHCKAPDGRPVLRIDSSNLDSVDQDKLESLPCDDLYLLLLSFLSWFNEHPKRHVRELTEYSQRFYLVERRGKFTKAITSSQTDAFCYGLALLAMLLNFYSEDCQYISHEESEEILLHYWRLVLPESAPKAELPADDSLPAYDDPDVFYNGLASYLTTYRNQIMHQRKAEPGTMAIVYSIDKESYLILPRTDFFRFYQSWLKEKGTSLDLAKETAIQRRLTDVGIQLKSESTSNKGSGKKHTYSWRFAFYANRAFYAKRKENLCCLGLPVTSLPESIQTLLNKPEEGGEH